MCIILLYSCAFSICDIFSFITMIISILLTCFFFMFLYYYIIQFSRKGRLINRIPGDMSFPIVGSLLHVCRKSTEEIWLYIHNLSTRYYPICKFWYFAEPIIGTMHPDHMKEILSSNKHMEKGLIYEYLHPWMGNGILTTTGTRWQKKRKMITPAFHFSILNQFVEIFIGESNRVMASLNHTEESIIENMQLFTSHHTLNAICETSMGVSLEDFGQLHEKYRQAVHHMSNIIMNRFIRPWLYIDVIFNLTSLGRMQDKYLNILHSFTEKVISKRKRYHEQTGERYLNYSKNLRYNTETEDMEVAGIKKKRMAMLDILLAESCNYEMTDLDIREDIHTIIFGGHDTISTSMCFSLLLLAEHKDIQARVRKEVCKVMQENNGKLTMNALQNLSYLERCLKESMRMYPSAPFIWRVSNEDVQLQPYLVPKGTMIILGIYELHHNPNYWPNPEVFDPDRFLPENIQKRHPYSYLPFSAGPRNCLGQRFALLELKALIAPMVYNFYLEPVDYLKDVKFKIGIVLSASNPIRMKLIPIKRT